MYKGGVTTNWIFMIILHPEERILLPNILIHFLKGKAEKTELDKAIKRAKFEGLL